jgi:hypothetical protein
MSTDFSASVKAAPYTGTLSQSCEHPHHRDGSLVDKWMPIGPVAHFLVTRAALLRWGRPTAPEAKPIHDDGRVYPGTSKDWE